jgi:hypothetical protein
MQDHEAGQKLLQGLSSTCEELSTNSSRRDQELQSLSELLQSIKQLQDQADEVSKAPHLHSPSILQNRRSCILLH